MSGSFSLGNATGTAGALWFVFVVALIALGVLTFSFKGSVQV